MTVKEAIRARIDRFNRLWMAAEGHTFEEDPKYMEEKQEKELLIWQENINKRANELGFGNEEEYYQYLLDNDIPYDKRDWKMQEMWYKKPIYSSLYDYEMTCINEAEKIVNFIATFGPDTKDNFLKLVNIDSDESVSISRVIDSLEKAGYEMDDGHSGNSAGVSIQFAWCLTFQPEKFQYMHGALSCLVGDKGYHDDRKDIPKN